MKIHKENIAFDQIEIMLKSLYEYDPEHRNTVFVLGYNIMKGNGIQLLRNLYPKMKIIIIQLEQMFLKVLG